MDKKSLLNDWLEAGLLDGMPDLSAVQETGKTIHFIGHIKVKALNEFLARGEVISDDMFTNLLHLAELEYAINRHDINGHIEYSLARYPQLTDEQYSQLSKLQRDDHFSTHCREQHLIRKYQQGNLSAKELDKAIETGSAIVHKALVANLDLLSKRQLARLAEQGKTKAVRNIARVHI
jgi:hypothetical protein